MRILWYNWRDIKHPDAGGAEVFTHEVMRRLTKKGYDTTLFTERFSNGLQLEYIDGVAQSICPARSDLQGYGIGRGQAEDQRRRPHLRRGGGRGVDIG